MHPTKAVPVVLAKRYKSCLKLTLIIRYHCFITEFYSNYYTLQLLHYEIYFKYYT